MRGGTTHLLSCVCQLARVTVVAPSAHTLFKASSLRPAPTTASSSDSLLRGDSLGGGSGGGWCGLLLRLVQGWAAWGGGGGSGMGGGGHSGARGLANGGGGWLTAVFLGGSSRCGAWWVLVASPAAAPGQPPSERRPVLDVRSLAVADRRLLELPRVVLGPACSINSGCFRAPWRWANARGTALGSGRKWAGCPCGRPCRARAGPRGARCSAGGFWRRSSRCARSNACGTEAMKGCTSLTANTP